MVKRSTSKKQVGTVPTSELNPFPMPVIVTWYFRNEMPRTEILDIRVVTKTAMSHQNLMLYMVTPIPQKENEQNTKQS